MESEDVMLPRHAAPDGKWQHHDGRACKHVGGSGSGSGSGKARDVEMEVGVELEWAGSE